MEDPYSYKDVACRTVDREPNLQGKFSLDDGFAWLHLLSFDGPFEVGAKEPVSIILEDGPVVTLVNSDGDRPGISLNQERRVFHQRLGSNLSVCGVKKWPPDAKIKSIWFEVTNSDTVLYHPEALGIALDHAAVVGRRGSLLARPKPYRVECAEVAVEFFFGHEEKSETWFDRHVHVRPVLTIEFREATSLLDGLDAAIACVRFLSFSAAIVVRPSRMSVQLWGTGDDDNREGRFLVFAKLPAAESREGKKADFRDSIWSLANDAERTMLFNSLRVWMDRRKTWRLPYELMEMALRHRPFLSGARLETAFKIIEALPLSKTEDESDARWHAKIDAVIKLVEENGSATELSATELGRVRNYLNILKGESGPMKLERLYDMLREQWTGKRYELSAWLFGNIREAWAERGSTAHGNIIIEEPEQDYFTTCVYAAEALAFFLLAHGLDLGTDPGRKLTSGQLVSYFRHGVPPQKDCEKYEAKYPKYKFTPSTKPADAVIAKRRTSRDCL